MKIAEGDIPKNIFKFVNIYLKFLRLNVQSESVKLVFLAPAQLSPKMGQLVRKRPTQFGPMRSNPPGIFVNVLRRPSITPIHSLLVPEFGQPNPIRLIGEGPIEGRRILWDPDWMDEL
jgi:hypothetical protein